MNVRTIFLLLLALAGLATAQEPHHAQHARHGSGMDTAATGVLREFTLYATDGTHTAADGRELYIWGYSLEPVPGTATLPGPLLEMNEGDDVRITLVNLGPAREGVHRAPHTIHLHGLDVDQANDGVPHSSASVRVGESFTYSFVAPHAGTYWYHCHVDTVEHLTMGMYGALVVHPPDGPGRAWTDGPAYDRSYTIVLSEMDPAWSDAVAQNRTPDYARFDARYFYMNGRSYPDTLEDPATHLVGRVGETALVRFVNAGYGWRSMHMHGFHFDVVASDGRPLPQPVSKDTLSIAPGERFDLLVTFDKPGEYPLHSHVILDNLNDGAYPGGMHTMITVAAEGEPLPEPHGHAHQGHTDEGARDEGARGEHAAHAGSPATARPAGTTTPRFGAFGRPNPAGGVAVALGVAAAAPAFDAPRDPLPDGAFEVTLERDRFHPEFLTVPVGATVVWSNRDPRSHSVVGRGLDSPDFGRGERWSHTFTEPGTYAYECANHRGMTGVVTVR